MTVLDTGLTDLDPVDTGSLDTGPANTCRADTVTGLNTDPTDTELVRTDSADIGPADIGVRLIGVGAPAEERHFTDVGCQWRDSDKCPHDVKRILRRTSWVRCPELTILHSR